MTHPEHSLLLLWCVCREVCSHSLSPCQAPTHLTFFTPAAPPGQQVSLVAVKGTKTILVSAYQEHRTGRREVSEEGRSPTVPRFTPRGAKYGKRVVNVHSDHFGFAYGTADIMCPLPSGCEKKPDHMYLEVKNKKTESDSFHYNFTVCISTMFDFNNMLQLVQSLETLQLLGVDRVVVYKTSSSPETQQILDYYTHKGLVEVIPWTLSRFLNVSRGWLPEHGPGEIHYFGQIPVLHDCLYRYMYQSRYVALHDIDELILPQKVFRYWSELLPLLEEKYGAKQCFMFQNNVFPNTVTDTRPSFMPSNWQNVPGVNILTHLYHEPVESGYGDFKIIVNPRAVGSSHLSLFVNVMSAFCLCRHAKQPKLTQDKLTYDDRLLSYGARFTPNVSTVLRECGLLQKDSIQ
uniref:Glycosyltransferase family 92 protein n=1 Tax=Sparus aurata TaxID=8175 RepID=A0A671TZ39_SPAAU